MRSALLLLTLALLLLGGPPARAQGRTYGSLYNAQYTGVEDADLVLFNIAGVHPLLGDRIGVKLRGVEVPARAGRCGQERQLAERARQVVAQLLKNARNVVLKDVGRGRIFRLTATVLVDQTDLREVLVKSGLAVWHRPGQPPRNWCE